MNKSCIIICLIVLATICSFAHAYVYPYCKQHNETCVASRECTTGYCRDQVCINYGESVENDVEEDPCATVDCRSGYKCIRYQVTCVKAPCQPIPRCALGAC